MSPPTRLRRADVALQLWLDELDLDPADPRRTSGEAYLCRSWSAPEYEYPDLMFGLVCRLSGTTTANRLWQSATDLLA